MIFGPILQVGWASASSAVTPPSSARVRPAERPARRGQDEPGDGRGIAPLEALEERGVLAVDREQQPSSPLLRGERELAGRDEALLVRQRERDAVLERPERRPNAGEADDGVEDDVRLAPLEQLDRVAADLDVLDAVLRREVVERRRARLERTELELGVRGDDLDRLTADRARGAEQRDASHGCEGCLRRLMRPCQGTLRRCRYVRASRAHVRGGSGPEERVHPVEHAAVAREEPARVLDPEVALDRGLEQVAERRGERDRERRGRATRRS